MNDRPHKPRHSLQALSALLALALLSACGPGKNATPTMSVDAIFTAAYTTMIAQQATQLALTPPSPTATETPLPTLPPAPTAALPTLAFTAPTTGVIGGGSTGLCDSSAFAGETIPDGTVMDPGKNFTKTWTFLNNGTCTWSTSYTLQFDSGDEMDGSTASVPNSVGPGNTVSISVKMTAPTSKGTYKGVWQLHNAGGAAFGVAPWVQIKVGSGPTVTPGGPTATAGPSPTKCSGSVTMVVSADVRDFTLSFSPSGPTYKGGGFSVDVTVPCGWTGKVTPSLEGTTFKPKSRTIDNFPPPSEIHFGIQ